ncbi:iron chaperone [Streptomyces sp. NPDC005209]|uniref:iron chaperone n=1 Tax=Streptomyces sp. NPDC005209 TaxID=3156715 RepID=UPI0033AAD96B
MKATQTSAKSTSTTDKTDRKYDGFTDEERDAMKARAQELKTAARRGSRAAKADTEGEVLAKIAEMPEADRVLAERIHGIVKASAPQLTPKLWYGMPAYAKNGKVVCFFQSAQKFKSRYATLGFSDQANLDDGAMWPTAFAVRELTPADEARIGELIKRAVS